MSIPVGTAVLVVAIKKHGLVAEVLSDGRYKVTIGALSIRVKESEILVSAPPVKPKQDKTAQPEGITIDSDAIGQWRSLARLDLHGLTVSEALRILEEHLSRSVMANISEVEVMHGVGSGKVKEAVLKHLKTLPVVKGFQAHLSNHGVTRVFI